MVRDGNSVSSYSTMWRHPSWRRRSKVIRGCSLFSHQVRRQTAYLLHLRRLCWRVVQVNASLANDIGNLLNRTLGLLAKNCGSTLPIAAATIPATHPLRELAEAQVRPSQPLSTLSRHVGKTWWGCAGWTALT